MLKTTFAPWPSFSEEEVTAVAEVLRSGRVNYWTGEQCREFEKEFAGWCGTDHAIALANGTLALEASLKGLGLGYGDEVIVPSRTFIATVSSVINIGAKPFFADVETNGGNLSAERIEAVLTPHTKAVICVHLAGWPCDMDPIMELAKEHGLFVIEDCAQAHGASYRGRSVGSIGHVGAWSFCQDKIMTTGGEGGMITTNDKDLWARMWSFKDHGKNWEAVYEKKHSPGFRWVHDGFGTNWRMTEMQAAIGRIQLGRMPGWHASRLWNAQRIWHVASHLRGLRVPEVPFFCEHAAYKCYLYVVPEYLKPEWSRDRIMQEITERGVPCYTGTCSEVYLEKAFDGTGYRPDERLPVARELGANSLMFLVHPTLTHKEIDRTCVVLSEVMRQAIK